jgi:hypothetical protein
LLYPVEIVILRKSELGDFLNLRELNIDEIKAELKKKEEREKKKTF